MKVHFPVMLPFLGRSKQPDACRASNTEVEVTAASKAALEEKLALEKERAAGAASKVALEEKLDLEKERAAAAQKISEATEKNVEMGVWVASLEAEAKEAANAGKGREAALASKRDELATKVASLEAEAAAATERATRPHPDTNPDTYISFRCDVSSMQNPR